MDGEARLALVCTLSDHFLPLWPALRPVSRGLANTARELWLVRMRAHELQVMASMDSAADTVCRDHPTLPRDEALAVVRSMAVLEGTAALMFEAIRSRAPRPATLRDLLGASVDGFDRPALRDLPVKALPSEFAFAHISECLIRTGEMRVFLGSIDDPWAENERLFRDAAAAYCRMQRHLWAWP